MGQEIIIKIEGLEALTKAMIVLAGSIQDHTAAMEKAKQVATISIAGPSTPIIVPITQDEDSGIELAVRDMYYFNKAKNNMMMIEKGQPLEVPAGFKSTTKAKFDEFFGEDSTHTGDSGTTPGDDPAPWEDEAPTVDGSEETICMEDLRAELVALGKAKGKEAAKKIISDLGAPQLSELDPTLYGKAMDAVKALLGK